jgi:integrase
MALTNKNVVFAPPGRHHAGVQGLYLWVSPDKSVRRWIYRYTSPVSRKVTEHGLGLIQILSLAEAQAKALDLQKQISQGHCPITAKRAAKFALITTQTFGQCCEGWLKTHEPGWRSQSQTHNLRVLLFGHGKPLLAVPVSAITPDMVQSTLSRLWAQHPNQAHRALAAFARVLDYARAKGMRQGDNPASWRGMMQYRFPRNKKTDRTHYTAMAYTQVPGLVRALVARQSRSVGAVALQFLILTAARTGEVLAMTWDEIDLDNRLWSLGGMRTKQGRPHQVPLSDRAMALLQARREQTSLPYVFSGYKRRQLSTKSMLHVLRAMEINVTVHGFRSSFRDWCGDTTEFAREHVEQCLGHAVGNGTEQAYRRSTALEKRRAIMQAWSDYCHDH